MSYACKAKGLEKSFRLNTGQAASCCKSYTETFDKNLPELIQLWDRESKKMVTGVQVPSCEQCWRDERAGKPSLRHQLNAHPELENKIDIYLNNLCNHMCSYCSPKFSSMWEDSIRSEGVFDRISQSAKANQSIDIELKGNPMQVESNLQQIKDYVSTQPDNSVVVSLLGGEPLMQHASLHKILEFDQAKVKRTVIITNLTPPRTKFLEQIIKKIDRKKLLMHISLDTAPEYNHIARHGFDCTRFEENFRRLRDNQIEYTILSTVSALAAFSLKEFAQWSQTHNITPTFMTLQNPSCLSIQCLSVEAKQQILQSVPGEFLTPELAWQLNTPEPARAIEFELYSYTQQYFARTGIKTSSMPENMQIWWEKLSKKIG